MGQLPIHLSDWSADTEYTHPEPLESQSGSDPTDIRTPSSPERFLNSFLDERSIRWLLLAGAAIVFGSSLMLVTKAWSGWSPAMRYLSVLAYTSATFVAAEFGRHRLKLLTTYKVLYGLTLLLTQICFMALMWFSADSTTPQTLKTIELIGLLLPAVAFLWISSRQILDHLLSGRQATFLNCYRLLCVAGFLPRFHSETGAFSFLLCCWAVFTIGVLKVNRHAFWLAEERRYMRVFGFLPILMLGLQFVVLTGTKAAFVLPAQWIGFCLVLTAFTVFMTSRAVTDVFRQRTGNLVRPLPWNIVVPVFVGTVLTVLGVMLSFTGFSPAGQTTYAVIPAAAIAGVLMWMMARDFQSSVFLWASLIFAAVSYQCSPALFSDIVQAVKNGAASAIRENRLPIAFYGLTYLPLIAVVAAGSRHYSLKNDPIFSRPMKHFASVLSGLLFALSLTHTKAAFLVALVNIPAFIFLGVLCRDRRFVVPSLLATVIAAASGIPALSLMGITSIPMTYIPVVLAALALIMVSTGVPDRLLNRIPSADSGPLSHPGNKVAGQPQHSLILKHADGRCRNLFQLTGGLLTLLMCGHWFTTAALPYQNLLTGPQLIQYLFLLAAFLLYAVRRQGYLNGLGFWVMVATGVLRFGVSLDFGSLQILNAFTMTVAGTSFLAYGCLRVFGVVTSPCEYRNLPRLGLADDTNNSLSLPGTLRLSVLIRTLAVPLCDFSILSMSCLAAIIHLPLIVKTHASVVSLSLVHSLPMSTGVAVVWLTIAAVIFRSRVAGFAATLALPLWITAEIISTGIPVAPAWYPAVWATLYGAALTVFRNLSFRPTSVPSDTAFIQMRPSEGIGAIVVRISGTVLMTIIILSSLSFEIPFRVAAAIALVATAVDGRRHADESQSAWLAVMTNLHLLLLVAAMSGSSGSLAEIFLRAGSAASVSYVFLTAAVSLAIFGRISSYVDPVISGIWTALIRAGMAVLTVTSLAAPPWASAQVLAMTAGFAVWTTAEFIEAVRSQRTAHVWSGVLAAVAGFVFLLVQGTIQCGAGLSQFVLLGVSALALAAAKSAESRSRLLVFRAPLSMVGHICPAFVACMAIGRQMAGMDTLVDSRSLMAMTAASGIYFQQAMVTRRRRFALMAIIIVNAALMLLLSSLRLSQAEFYLVPSGLSILGFVELFGRELPSRTHDPLRYLGALTILVSPMFEILDGSWGHMLGLLLLSVFVILLSIGLRLRSLVYTGSAFLVTDLAVMVIRSHETYPFLPWLCGIAVGAGVIGFAAFCENHRENVLSRIRMLSAELATWR